MLGARQGEDQLDPEGAHSSHFPPHVSHRLIHTVRGLVMEMQ